VHSTAISGPDSAASFGPKHEKFQPWIIPSGGGIVHFLYVMPNGSPVLANTLTNEAGLAEIE
jgi:virginiamycin B lyase